jgi:hypothetical protein
MEAVNIKAYPTSASQVEALKAFMKALKIKYEVTPDAPYDPEFVAKIERGREDFRKGKGIEISINELNELCK